MIPTAPSTNFLTDIQMGRKTSSSHQQTKALSFHQVSQWKTGAIPKPTMSAKEMGVWWLAEIPWLRRLGPCRKGERTKDTLEATPKIPCTLQLDLAPSGHASPAIFIFGFPACSTVFDTCGVDNTCLLSWRERSLLGTEKHICTHANIDPRPPTPPHFSSAYSPPCWLPPTATSHFSTLWILLPNEGSHFLYHGLSFLSQNLPLNCTHGHPCPRKNFLFRGSLRLPLQVEGSVINAWTYHQKWWKYQKRMVCQSALFLLTIPWRQLLYIFWLFLQKKEYNRVERDQTGPGQILVSSLLNSVKCWANDLISLSSAPSCVKGG